MGYPLYSRGSIRPARSLTLYLIKRAGCQSTLAVSLRPHSIFIPKSTELPTAIDIVSLLVMEARIQSAFRIQSTHQSQSLIISAFSHSPHQSAPRSQVNNVSYTAGRSQSWADVYPRLEVCHRFVVTLPPGCRQSALRRLSAGPKSVHAPQLISPP